MSVRLLIHLERVSEAAPGFVWWAETDDVQGFSAAADHLPELLEQAETALRELLGTDPVIEYRLVNDAEEGSTEGARLTEELHDSEAAGFVFVAA